MQEMNWIPLEDENKVDDGKYIVTVIEKDGYRSVDTSPSEPISTIGTYSYGHGWHFFWLSRVFIQGNSIHSNAKSIFIG